MVRAPGDTVLLIVGHGASDAPGAADAATAHVGEIISRGIFGDVRAGFLRQEPFAKDVLRYLGDKPVVVVPHFASDGYIVTEILPGELGLTAKSAVSITPAIGSHADIPRIAAELVFAQTEQSNITLGTSDVVVVGHGTKRNSSSETSTARLAESVLALTDAASCTAAFLEIDPLVEDWRTFAGQPDVVVLPNLFAAGFHGAEDIPARLGEPGHQRLHLCPPLGTAPAMADLIVDQALAQLTQPDEASRVAG